MPERFSSIVEPAAPPPASSARLIELIEARSAESQHRCAPPEIADRLGLEQASFGAARLVLTRNSKNLIYNRLIGLGQRTPATRHDIARLLRAAREHRAPAVAVPITPAARPRRLVEWFEQSGFQPGSPGAKLWRTDVPLPRRPRRREKISVQPVRPARPGVWVDVVAQIWRTFGSRRAWFEARVGAPGWHHYVATINGQAVGAGALFSESIFGVMVGHLVDGVTHRDARCLGVQGEIIRRRLRDGLKLGCSLFCSETAPPLPRMPLVSYRNLRRHGFELAYLRESWNLQLR